MPKPRCLEHDVRAAAPGGTGVGRLPAVPGEESAGGKLTMPRGRKPDLKRRGQVMALRKRGLALREIARRLGVSRQAVGQLLRAAGYPPLSPEERRRLASIAGKA